MKLSIDMDQRYAKMRAHTATHLLHAELGKIFPDTKQAGSLVDEDLLRFDFYANNLLTAQQIREIENNINRIIYSAYPVDLIETTFDEGVKL
jgi:alanyl-tRNA synthetase